MATENKFQLKEKGYTLIEVMVAVGIFFTIVAVPTGFFIGSIKGQQKALSSQELVGDVSYGLEYISRAIRMAKKELNCADKADPLTCGCLKNSGYGFNYEMNHGDKGIKFINYQGVCQEFFWDTTDNRLKETKNGGEAIPLTSNDLEIISFKIWPTDSWDQNNNKQPQVTLFLEIKGKRYSRPELQPVLRIQTTISQRNLNVIY